MRRQTRPSLIQIMVCRLLGAKPLSDAMLAYCQLDPWELISVKFYQNTTIVIENSELEKVACKLAAILYRLH